MITKWELPPIEKIHEALSAIADNRVDITKNSAIVASSNNQKKYTVTWEENIYISNDNASFYQGYIGYPVIAVLFLQGKLTLNKDIANYFANINWHDLNNKFKRKYSEVVEYIFEDFKSQGINVDEINEYINNVFEELKKLDILYKRSKLYPPN